MLNLFILKTIWIEDMTLRWSNKISFEIYWTPISWNMLRCDLTCIALCVWSGNLYILCISKNLYSYILFTLLLFFRLNYSQYAIYRLKESISMWKWIAINKWHIGNGLISANIMTYGLKMVVWESGISIRTEVNRQLDMGRSIKKITTTIHPRTTSPRLVYKSNDRNYKFSC